MARTDSGTIMTAPVQHDSFVLERHYPASASLVFRCWSTLADKKRWFFCEDWGPSEHTLDFRVGGRDAVAVGGVAGRAHLRRDALRLRLILRVRREHCRRASGANQSTYHPRHP